MNHSHKPPSKHGKRHVYPPKAPLSGPSRNSPNNYLASAAFQQKVERLDKLMQLAAVTPKAPPGFTLVKEPGTLEQVGHEADAAWAGVKRIMSILNVETKWLHINSALNINYTGSIISDCCSLITQGVSGTQRVGDSIKVRRIMMKGMLQYNGTATDVTVVIGRSKDGIPAVADLFDLSGSTSTQAGMSFPNDNQTQADKWLMSHHLFVDQYTPLRQFYFDIKIGKDTQYSPGAATVTTGAVWIAAISGTNTTPPTIAYNYVMEYVDN